LHDEQLLEMDFDSEQYPLFPKWAQCWVFIWTGPSVAVPVVNDERNAGMKRGGLLANATFSFKCRLQMI
jgi:hypothetical protein